MPRKFEVLSTGRSRVESSSPLAFPPKTGPKLGRQTASRSIDGPAEWWFDFDAETPTCSYTPRLTSLSGSGSHPVLWLTNRTPLDILDMWVNQGIVDHSTSSAADRET